MSRSAFLAGTSSERERATRIGVARIVVGSALLNPGLARRAFAVPAVYDTPMLRMLSRLSGIRNAALGAWALRVRDRDVEERLLCYTINAVVDGADLAVIAWAMSRDRSLFRTGVMSLALGGSACLAWLDLLGDI